MNAAADRALEVLVLRGVAWGRLGQVGIKAAMPSFQTMKSSGGLQSCSESRKIASRETKLDRRPRRRTRRRRMRMRSRQRLMPLRPMRIRCLS